MKLISFNIVLLILSMSLFWTASCFGQNGKTKSSGKREKAKKTAEKEEKDEVDQSSTKFDFDEALLEGKMKAPSGMMLKGRVNQSKSQMVQLRQNWRSDLKKSDAAVRAIKPKD